jgi:hypothetical protein
MTGYGYMRNVPAVQFQLLHYHSLMGRDSSVGIATRYWLDGPEIESRVGGEIFPTRPDRPPGGPIQTPVKMLYRVFPGGKAAEGWC